jgi:cell division protein ZapE
MNLDNSQLIIKNKLDELAQNLQSQKSTINLKKNLLNLFKTTPPQKEFFGFYIYGDVGRGKTMLMKNFYEKITDIAKIYFHFNGFMILLHKTLHQIRQNPQKNNDDLIEALKKIITDQKIICFDEFQVLDVADAMLLARIFEYFFSQKITVVITSNLHPQNLYKNGLQREVFLEFVNKILLKKIEVLSLNSAIDYRSYNRTKLTKRFFVSNQKNREIFQEIITNFTKNKTKKALKISSWGREIIVKKAFENVAIFNFEDLFNHHYSSADFKEICQKFNLIFLQKIPTLQASEINEIRRFTLFIDEVYEHKILLIMISKTSLNNLKKINEFAPYFSRTISRINEIISDKYWNENLKNFH